jgi:PPP family 3-phenylpropionic acid transporter
VVASLFVLAADEIGGATLARTRFHHLRALLSSRLWVVIIAVALINAGHAYYYTFGNLHWSRDLGYSSALLGMLWGTGVLFEIGMFSRFGDDGSTRRALTLILAGAVGGVIRWSVTAFDPPLSLLFALQTLHGLSFAATILGGLRLVKIAVPREVNPLAIGLFAAMVHGVVIGIVMALLATRLGATAETGYLFMAALSAAGGIGVILLALTKKLHDPL